MPRLASIDPMPTDSDPTEIMRQARELRGLIRMAAQTVRFRQAIQAPLPEWITDLEVDVWLAVRRRLNKG